GRLAIASESVLFFCPFTSLVSVWVPTEIYTPSLHGALTISVGKYVSIWALKTPSTYTLAIPVVLLRLPIQLTEVPVKVNVACAPAAGDAAVLPMLHALLRLPCVQVPL